MSRFPQATLPRILGRDYAGRVIEGPEDFIGTAVWGSGGGILGLTQDGSHAEHMVLPLNAVIARPSHLSAEAAAVAGVPFVAAWSALVELGRFQAGEWAVISGAGGAVGSAAVALAKALGGHAIAVDLSKVDLGPPLSGLDVDGVLGSDTDDVPKAVLELTGGRGADVALNAVGARPSFCPARRVARAIAGRMVVFSASPAAEVHNSTSSCSTGAGCSSWGSIRPGSTWRRLPSSTEKFGPLFGSGALTPPSIALARFPLSAAREAYERVAARRAMGKVVLHSRRGRRKESGSGTSAEGLTVSTCPDRARSRNRWRWRERPVAGGADGSTPD